MRRNTIAASLVTFLMIAIPALAGLQARAADEPVRNVILMIGDGMGAFQRQAAAEFEGRTLEMDQMPIKGVVTNPAANWRVTDSAAAATAMATGHKTSIGAISVAPDGTRLETILERARKNGLLTGLVSTSSITHATPAAFAAHQILRSREAAIAQQLLENRVDVLFGGGRSFFMPGTVKGSRRHDRSDLLGEAGTLGYSVAGDEDGLRALSTLPALGLFAGEGLNPDLDREGTRQPSIAGMTEKALELLSSAGKGFFLMVEGSEIDWACQVNDPAWAVTEVAAFDRAVAAARQFTAAHPGTLLIVVADHETGGMGRGPAYAMNMDVLRRQKATGQAIAQMAAANPDPIADLMRQLAGVDDLSPAELNALTHSSNLELAVNRIMSARAGISWATYSHTSKPIPLTAEGSRADLFAGYYDNTDIYRKIVSAFGWE